MLLNPSIIHKHEYGELKWWIKAGQIMWYRYYCSVKKGLAISLGLCKTLRNDFWEKVSLIGPELPKLTTLLIDEFFVNKLYQQNYFFQINSNQSPVMCRKKTVFFFKLLKWNEKGGGALFRIWIGVYYINYLLKLHKKPNFNG